jgi:hypothetical protein
MAEDATESLFLNLRVFEVFQDLQHKLELLHKKTLAVERFSGYKNDCDEGLLYVHCITHNEALHHCHYRYTLN